MSETKVKIVEAAFEAFSRYGLRRVSMGDVAEAAGISRQTLYSHYKNKDELFAAAMTEAIDKIVKEMTEAWGNSTNISEKIDAYFVHSVIGPFKMIQLQPDLKELLHGVGDNTTAVAKNAEVEKAKLLAEQLTPFAARLSEIGSSPMSVAEFVVRVSTDLKLSVNELGELDNHLRTLKSAVLAMLGATQ